MDHKGRIKKWIMLGIVLILAITGLSKLRIETVSSYQKGQITMPQTTEEKRERPDTVVQEKKNEIVSTTGAAIVQTVSPKAIDSKHTKAPKQKEETKKKQIKNTATPKPTQKAKETEKKKKKSVKKQKAEATPSRENQIQCTIAIRCDSLAENIQILPEHLRKYVPKDGAILPETKIWVDKGSSVYQALAYACKTYGIALDAEYSPVFGTEYVKGIGHLYEKDAGDMSGWLYKVNDVKPNVGASKYTVEEGDKIVWGYTCDGRGM